MGQTSGTKNGPIWLQLQNTISMEQTKGTKDFNIQQKNPQLNLHICKKHDPKNTTTWNIWPQEKSLQKLSLTSVFTTTHILSLRS